MTDETGASMSEQFTEKVTEEPQGPSGPVLSPGRLLTPQASAIAGFAFAVFSMLGQGSWSTALSTLVWGDSFGMGSVRHVMAVWGVGCLAMAALGIWLAHRTLQVADHAWEGQLARATVIVAALGALLAVLTIIGGVVHGL